MTSPDALNELKTLQLRIVEPKPKNLLETVGRELYGVIFGHPALREEFEERIFYYDNLRKSSDFLRLESELIEESVSEASKTGIQRLTNPNFYHRFGELGTGVYKPPFDVLRGHCDALLQQYTSFPENPNVRSLKAQMQHKLIGQPYDAKLWCFEYLALVASRFGHYEYVDAKRMNPDLFEREWMPDEQDSRLSDEEQHELELKIQKEIVTKKGFTIFDVDDFLRSLKVAALHVCDAIPRGLSALQKARLSLPSDCIMLDTCIALETKKNFLYTRPAEGTEWDEPVKIRPQASKILQHLYNCRFYGDNSAFAPKELAEKFGCQLHSLETRRTELLAICRSREVKDVITTNSVNKWTLNSDLTCFSREERERHQRTHQNFGELGYLNKNTHER